MKPAIINTIIGILFLLAGTVSAQKYTGIPRQRTAYEESLLDSAYRYELLKPTFFSLKTAYEYRGKEVEDLRNALRLFELQSKLQQEELARQASENKRRERRKLRKGLIVGTVCGILITTLIH